MSSRERRAAGAVILFCGTALMCACSSERASDSVVLRGADMEHGKAVIQYYGCNACHAVAGLPAPQAPVAAPITDISERGYIAGMLPTTPENLIRWIRFPHEVKPATAMPELGVSEGDARDIAAYLYSLR